MREWAEKHIKPQKMKIVAKHVKRLVECGSVTEDRVMGHTMNQIPKPILVCEHPEGLGEENVDGNHTYVATALCWEQAIELGLAAPSDTPFVICYGLIPEQWRPFVVPVSQLRKRFKDLPRLLAQNDHSQNRCSPAVFPVATAC